MIRKTLTIAYATCAALLLAGCATSRGPIGQATDVELTDLTVLPAPDAPAFVIGQQQELQINVLQSDLLTGKYLTNERGGVYLPLIGEVAASGRTPDELAREIESRLTPNYVINPQVTVFPANVITPTVSVGGEVVRSGTYPAATSTTLLRAIYNAGGLDEYGDAEEVLVIRTAQGRRYIGVFDFEAISRGNYPDPAIYSGDVIAVGDSPQRRRLDRILQLIPALASAAILVDRVQN